MGSPEFSDALCFSYGQAVYQRGGKSYEGEVILSPHKLYLKDGGGEISATLVPLEKIYRLRVFWGVMIVFVRPSNFMQFEARIKGMPGKIRALLKDLVEHRQFKKKFLGFEWYDPDFFVV